MQRLVERIFLGRVCGWIFSFGGAQWLFFQKFRYQIPSNIQF